MRTVTLRPLSGTLGAQVDGIDIRRVDEATVDELRTLLARHHLLLFRDQDPTPREHASFAGRFGPLRGDFAYVLSKATRDRTQLFQLTLQTLL